MKKIFFTLLLTAFYSVGMANANSNSDNDDNQKGSRAEVVDDIKKNASSASSQQHVNANDLNILLQSLYQKAEKLEAFEAQLDIFESSFGISNPSVVKFQDIKVGDDTYHLGVSGAIDLGISIKWAAINVGALSPGDYGDYFAWGETQTQYIKNYAESHPCKNWREGKDEGYLWSSYSWCEDGDLYKITKYCTTSSYGKRDDKRILEDEDDVACMKWNGQWRIPTADEAYELCRNCTWIYTNYEGKNGYIVVGPNGNAIFMPAAGHYKGKEFISAEIDGQYWTSIVNGARPDTAIAMVFNSKSSGDIYGSTKCYGFSVRPVCPK